MSTPAAGPAIRLAGVSVIYGPRPAAMLPEILRRKQTGESLADIRVATGHVPALTDVALEIPAGSLFVVMGLSGAGKSTLLRTINRLVTPLAGEVRVGDTHVTALDPSALRRFRQNVTAMAFQHFGLLPHRNCLDNVAFPLRLQGRAAPEARAAAARWLDRLGLAAVAGSAIDTLSAGMKQRVGIARALVTGAPVLLMDEPFGALDPITRRDLQDELKRLQRDLRKTVVLITHDPHEAVRLADRMAVVHDGRVVQAGTSQELIHAPADPHVAALFASASA